MSNFQIAIFVIFFIFILISVLLFTGVIPGFRSSSGGSGGEVVVWGTVPRSDLMPLVNDINREHKDRFSITYEQKSSATYESELVEALAAGVGPDVFFLPHDLVLKHQDKVRVIPYEAVSARSFRDGFIEQGELFLVNEGILAFPFIVDPLVMYWNRDLFSEAGIAQPPTYWDEFFTIAPNLTEEDEAGDIEQSAAPLGTFSNIPNAKGVVSSLVLQTGNKIVERTTDGEPRIVFGNQEQKQKAESAVRFYTQFADPANPLYTWNPSLDNAQNQFLAGDLAMYFGYASELEDIVLKNPHLNFDVAMLPQVRDREGRKTFAHLTGLAIAKNSNNQQTALQVVSVLTSQTTLTELAKVIQLPPVRRDLLSWNAPDAYSSVFYDAAIASTGWLDPAPEKTYTIFSDMVSGIASGRVQVGQAVTDAQTQLSALIRGGN